MPWLAAIRPIDTDGIARWSIALMIVFVAAREIGWAIRRSPTRDGYGHITDAATFAQSVLLLYGIFDTDVLRAIGDFKLFLGIAGLAGLRYSLATLLR